MDGSIVLLWNPVLYSVKTSVGGILDEMAQCARSQELYHRLAEADPEH